jgi:hypothetical protein
VIVTNAVPGTWIRLCDSALSSESSRAPSKTAASASIVAEPTTVAAVAPVTAFVTSFAVAP